MHLGALCMQLRAPVSFYSLWEGQMECFLVPQRDLGCFCAGAVAPKPALF